MTAMNELHMAIGEEIERGELSFRQIAIVYEVSYATVEAIAREIAEQVALDDSDYIADNDYFDDY